MDCDIDTIFVISPNPIPMTLSINAEMIMIYLKDCIFINRPALWRQP